MVGMLVNVANQCNSRINYRDMYYKRTLVHSLMNVSSKKNFLSQMIVRWPTRVTHAN